jgi:hypothetical protein
LMVVKEVADPLIDQVRELVRMVVKEVADEREPLIDR